MFVGAHGPLVPMLVQLSTTLLDFDPESKQNKTGSRQVNQHGHELTTNAAGGNTCRSIASCKTDTTLENAVISFT